VVHFEPVVVGTPDEAPLPCPSEHNEKDLQNRSDEGGSSLTRSESVASSQISETESFNSHQFYNNSPNYGRMESGENYNNIGMELDAQGTSTVFFFEERNNRYNDLISNPNLTDSDR
jgi:hypothetical protein